MLSRKIQTGPATGVDHDRPFDFAEKFIVEGPRLGFDRFDVFRPLNLACPANISNKTGKGRAGRNERQVDRQVLLSSLLLLVGLVDLSELLRFSLPGALLNIALGSVPFLSLGRRLVIRLGLSSGPENEVILPTQFFGRFCIDGLGEKGFFQGNLGLRPDRIDGCARSYRSVWG